MSKNSGQEPCVHELFAIQAAKQPDALAVVQGSRAWSYGELERRSNQLARHLQTLGVGPEVPVGICIERSLEMVLGLLSILKAGGAYVPLDPAYPQERLSLMLRDSQVPILLTRELLLTQLPAHKAQTICLDRDWPACALQSTAPLTVSVSRENLAYIIYTSGSTGTPKGVQLQHGGLLNLVFWHQQAFSISSIDRATQIAAPAFDASVWELWPYLAAGASISIPDEETRNLPAKLRDWLISSAITISFLPTPLAERILSLDWPADGALRVLLTGGDVLHYYPPASLPFQLINNYGPTENTVVATSGQVLPAVPSGTLPSIGLPIAQAQVFLLDYSYSHVPIGVPGELYISGSGLARGYLGRPDLTAERFIPHPFAARSGERLYKTGDLACFNPDGTIAFFNRIDRQVKIRGFRIELGEIEAALASHPGVREIAVLAREMSLQEKRLEAYFVKKGKYVLSGNELRQFLQERLPGYMVPALFIPIEAIPLTYHNKPDYQALLNLSATSAKRANASEEPRVRWLPLSDLSL